MLIHHTTRTTFMFQSPNWVKGQGSEEVCNNSNEEELFHPPPHPLPLPPPPSLEH